MSTSSYSENFDIKITNVLHLIFCFGSISISQTPIICLSVSRTHISFFHVKSVNSKNSTIRNYCYCLSLYYDCKQDFTYKNSFYQKYHLVIGPLPLLKNI